MAAPIPGRRNTAAVGIATLLLLLAAAGLFYYVRRYSLAHPERLDHFSRPSEFQASSFPDATVLHASSPIIGKTDPRWEIVGFHPSERVLYNFILSAGFMIPVGLFVNFYIPMKYVNPFVEARGEWTIVGQLMQVFRVLLELGTTQAMVKYLAQYRISEPRRAVTYIQVAIWFHLLGGLCRDRKYSVCSQAFYYLERASRF
jgi:hypothetical protein